jgi:hypothetical protein
VITIAKPFTVLEIVTAAAKLLNDQEPPAET